MPKLLTLDLDENERVELETMRDTHPKPYMRERASALLQIADGSSGRHVAFHGLLKPRATDTVYSWLHRYEEEGIEGLEIREGRGRKPSYFPGQDTI